MSSTYSSDPPRWWSLAPKHPTRQQNIQRQYSPEKSSRAGGLSSIAVALGLKSKKHPVLAIQDPIYPSSRPSVPAIVTQTTHRPPSKSVSSPQSQADSFGPSTPQDPQTDNRHSLLTISDTDPFAVRTIVSAPHTPSDPGRLSAYSDTSSPDLGSKTAETTLNRASYGSSSQSHAPRSDLSPLTLAPASDLPSKLKSKKSVGSLHRKQSLMAGDQSLGSAWESLSQANKPAMLKAASTMTSTPDKNRFSQPEATPIPRPPMRARGMTDSGAVFRPDIMPNNIASTPKPSLSNIQPGPSPRVVIRQPSVSRMGLPTSAPPRQELPPPPLATKHRNKDNDLTLPVLPADSVLSPSLSSASRTDIVFDPNYSPDKRERPSLERSSSARVVDVLDTPHARLAASSPLHTLKKAVSHQSFGRQPLPSTSSIPVPVPEIPTPSKAPRKQRSFHQPKLPLPPLSPLRPSTSFGTQTTSSIADSPAPLEQRRGSAGVLTLPGRKRLFSGSNSRRPSTSQAAFAGENDSQSIFSVRSVPDQIISSPILKSTSQPISLTSGSSFWDEVSPLDPSPRTIPHEYTPRQIMTPAELAKLEASADVINGTGRQRTVSILSASTMVSAMSDGDVGFSPPTSGLTDAGSINGVTNTLMRRTTSVMSKGLSAPPQLSSTSQGSTRSPSISQRSSPISSPPSPSMTVTSLPPPPRRPRPRPALEEEPIVPSLPPPPVRRFVRPKISVEKILHRRSIMRKPSFLEISDGESDNETDTASLEEPPSGSFLDLARESFDTSRSISE